MLRGSQALPDGRRSPRPTTTGDPEGEPLDEHDAADGRGARGRARGASAARSSFRSRRRRPSRSAVSARTGCTGRGVAVEMPLRRSRVDALDVIAYADGIATLDLRVGSGTYVRSIADALGGHCVDAAANGGRAVPRRGGRRERRSCPSTTRSRGSGGPMRIVHAPSQLERQPRAVAIGTFDGVHRGHRAVVAGGRATPGSRRR